MSDVFVREECPPFRGNGAAQQIDSDLDRPQPSSRLAATTVCFLR